MLVVESLEARARKLVGAVEVSPVVRDRPSGVVDLPVLVTGDDMPRPRAMLAPELDAFLELKRGARSTAAGISLLERVADVAKLLAERQRLVAIER